MNDSTQEIKNIALVFKDTFGPIEIRELVKKTLKTTLSNAKIDKIIRSVLQSSKQAKMSAKEHSEIIDLLSSSFSKFKEEEWSLESSLGEGAYGTVRSMSFKSFPSKKVAQKKFMADEISVDIVREIGCYSLLSASRPTLYDDIVSGMSLTKDNISIALKLADGSLYDFAKTVTPEERIEMFSSVFDMCVDNLAYIHACNIIHSDIKPMNMLTWWTDNKITRILLADFGISTSRPGTTAYTKGFKAPEIDGHTNATKESDIWALGISLIVFLTLYKPWDGETIDWSIVDKTNRSGQLKLMLNEEPTERYSLTEPILTFPKRDWSINPESIITARVYRMIFDWIWPICRKFRIQNATFIQTIDIMCRFCHVFAIKRLDEIQCYGSAAFLLAYNWGDDSAGIYESSMVEFAGNAFKVEQLEAAEQVMLEKLYGLVYIPGLETMVEKLSQMDHKDVRKELGEFVPNHLDFLR